MPRTRDAQAPTLGQAVELFKARFQERHPASHFLIDGDGYGDEDLVLTIIADGDQIALEQFAAEISHAVEAATGFFILPFVQPPGAEQVS